MKIQIINDIIKKYKAKIIVAVIIAILTGLIALLFNLWQNAIIESKRKDTIILTKTKEYYTKDSLKVIEVTQQQMTIKEYEELNKKYVEKIKSMNIKTNRLEEIISTNIQVSNNFIPNVSSYDSITFFTDSIVYDTIKVYNEKYNDGYLDYKRIQIGDKAPVVSYTYTDSLLLVVNKYHKIEKRPKFLPKLREKLGRKNDYKINAVFSNKACKISDLRYIKIK